MQLDRLILCEAEEIRLLCQQTRYAALWQKGWIHKRKGRINSSPDALIVSPEDLIECVYKICEHSWYAYQEDINKGFITIKGGHRAGIIGTPVTEDGKIINIKDISSINFRIAEDKRMRGEHNQIPG